MDQCEQFMNYGGKVMYAKDIDDPFVVKTENNPDVVI